MIRFGTPELLIVLVIVLLIFGVGRIGKIAGEMGKGIREFRTGLKGDKDAGGSAEDTDTPKGSTKKAG